jgi:uncharacterized protein YpmS
MNKWKIAFWILLALSISIIALVFYKRLDSRAPITYMKEEYSDTEDDLKSLVKILNQKSLSKRSILNILGVEKPIDTVVSLKRYYIVFKNWQLDSIKPIW